MNEVQIRETLTVLVANYKAAEKLRVRAAGHADAKVNARLDTMNAAAEAAAIALAAQVFVDLNRIAEALEVLTVTTNISQGLMTKEEGIKILKKAASK